MNDFEMDARLADDRPITYSVTTVDGRTFTWIGTPALVNHAITIRSGPMVLLCEDGTILNFSQVISLEPRATQHRRTADHTFAVGDHVRHETPFCNFAGVIVGEHDLTAADGEAVHGYVVQVLMTADALVEQPTL